MNRAGHLFARKDGSGRKFLLIGHLDTVFEADDGFQAFQRDGNIATGPGISDMKSGNVVIVYALKALQAIGALAGHSGGSWPTPVTRRRPASRCRFPVRI
jgi:glutamate carboxypeptidase